jgi:hypothetical protein
MKAQGANGGNILLLTESKSSFPAGGERPACNNRPESLAPRKGMESFSFIRA